MATRSEPATRSRFLAVSTRERVHGLIATRKATALAALASLLAHVVVFAAIFATASSVDEHRRRLLPQRDEVVAFVEPTRIEHQRAPRAESTMSRFDARMRARRSRLERGHGYYEPLSSWTARGVRYYRVAYAFVYRNGTFESGVVPWDVHFARRADPFVRVHGAAAIETPLPPPPPDYLPPGTLGKLLRAYFPQLTFVD
jgi:hypothetical protein